MLNLKAIALLSVFFATFAKISVVALPGINPARCGNEDGDLVRNKRWGLFHHGQKDKTVTYKITNYSRNLTRQDVDDIIQRAFNTWTEHTDLIFVQKRPNEDADIDIRFAIRNHGCQDSFDGRGGVLAHANSRFTHFDDEEWWKVRNNDPGTSLYIVAVHEFGHSLGLGHTEEEAALMFRFLGNNDESQFRLHDDDVKGIQEIYGDKKEVIPYSEELCRDPTFDTMFETPDEKTYIFKRDKYYELNPVDVIDGPRPISEKWRGLPNSITAAFSQNGKTFFFKSGQYWRFTGYEMDPGYPRSFSGWYSKIPHNFNTATVWEDGKVYFFRGSKYWRIDEFNEQDTIITEGLLKDDWQGIPNYITAVHRGKRFGFTLFFKDDNFYAYETAAHAPRPYVMTIKGYFFGCRSRE